MAFLFGSAELVIKATLNQAEEQICRRITLVGSHLTSFSDFITAAESHFKVDLSAQCSYQDLDGDRITVSTDAEWAEATTRLGASLHVRVSVAEDSDEWEVVSPKDNNPLPASTSAFSFYLNGTQRTVDNVNPDMRLIEYLRTVAGLTGAKQGCNEGGCGCCTVAMSNTAGVFVSINSCLRLLASVAGRHVWTTEGIGNDASGYHAVQKALAEGNGSQCGYCSPGWVMNMWSLLQRDKKWTPAEIEQQFDGNLCRCTGYRPILESFKDLVSKPSAGPKACCSAAPPTEEPAPMLYVKSNSASTTTSFAQPNSLEQLWQLVEEARSDAFSLRFVNANTSAGVAKYFPPNSALEMSQHVVDVTAVPELEQVQAHDDGSITVGSGVTIAQLIELLGTSTASCAQLALKSHLLRVANVQVRSVGSWAGNLLLTRAHPGFGSDVATIFAAAGVVVTVGLSATATRTHTVPELLAMSDSEIDNTVVLSAMIPSLKNSILHTEKTAMRHVNSHAIVNAAILATTDGDTITDCTVVFGGLAAHGLLHATATEAAIKGTVISNAKETFATALASLKQDLAVAGQSDDPRQTPEYRMGLARNFLYRFFLSAAPDKLPAEYASCITGFAAAADRPVSSGVQTFKTDPTESPIGDPIVKLSALKQASGEAKYTSDLLPRGALHGALVITKNAGGTIASIDVTAALAMPGVVDVVRATDLQAGCNQLPFKETLFLGVGDVSLCWGSAVGLVLAETEAQARAVVAAEAVKITYSDAPAQPPAQQSIADAVEELREQGGLTRRRVHPHIDAQLTHAATKEDWSIAVASNHNDVDVDSAYNFTGTVSTGAQRHFYMETQASVAVPQEGAIEVHCSCQDLAYTNAAIAAVLKIPQHKVVIKMRRAGGGFGGKLNRHMPVAAAASVAAMKHGVPVAVQNERVADLSMTGGREPINAKSYSASFDSTGVLNSVDLDLTIDCGSFVGESVGDASMAVQFSDNVYYAAKYECKATPITSATAHGTSQRAPGVLQSQFIHECVIERVAHTLGLPHHVVQERNFYQVNQVTPYGDHIGTIDFDWTIPQLWKQLTDDTDLENRRTAVEAYNKANKWRKRGIATQPVKYGMGLPFYKSGATVNVYADGSVSVAHGGCEVGQGIHTIAAQVAAGTLGVPLSSVMVQDTDTSKIPHNTCTGGSGTTECTAEAVREACVELAATVKKYQKEPTTSWTDAVTLALAAGESLSAASWYSNGAKDNANAYATYGVAASEVEIDVLTGEVQLLRTDIVMDLGQALNPDIAIGQLEGGFVMAMGFLLTEEVLWAKDGEQLNLGSWNYKIPSAYDIPEVLNVSLLEGHRNTSRNAVLGSKACAEPAMPLAISAFFAVKQAIYSARVDRGNTDFFDLNTPATVQAIATACLTQETDLDVPF